MLLLLANKFRIWFAAFRHQHGSRRRGTLLATLAFGIFPVWVFTQARQFFHAWTLRSDADSFIFGFLLMTFWGLLIFFIFSSISLTVHFNFLTRELEYLFSLPFSHRSIFIYQLFNTTLANLPLYLGLGLSILFALGISFQAHFLYYPFILVLSIFFLIMSTAVATILSLFLVKMLSAKYLRTIATLIMSLLFIVAWISLQLAGTGQLKSGFAANIRFDFTQIHLSPYPPAWYAQCIYGFISGKTAITLITFLLFSTVSILLMFISLNMLEHSFSKNYPAAGVVFPPMHIRLGHDRLGGLYSFSCSFAIIKRDIALLLRDSRHLLQLIMFNTMLIIIPFIRTGDQSTLTGPLDISSPFAIMLYLLAVLTANNSARSIPMERLSFGYVKSAPISMHSFLLAKIAYNFLFSLVAVMITLSIFYLKYHISALLFLSVLGLSLIFIIGSSGIGIFFGAFFAKFNWDHPKHLLQTGGFFYIAVCCFVFWLITLATMSYMNNINVLTGLLTLTLISFGLMFFGTALAKFKLDRQDWVY